MKKLLPLALAGCFLGPEIVYDWREPMEPVPEAYAQWYAEVEACWGASGDFAAVEWFVGEMSNGDPVTVVKETTKGDVITIRSGYELIERTIKHGMSHHVSGLGHQIHYEGANRAYCDT